MLLTNPLIWYDKSKYYSKVIETELNKILLMTKEDKKDIAPGLPLVFIERMHLLNNSLDNLVNSLVNLVTNLGKNDLLSSKSRI